MKIMKKILSLIFSIILTLVSTLTGGIQRDTTYKSISELEENFEKISIYAEENIEPEGIKLVGYLLITGNSEDAGFDNSVMLVYLDDTSWFAAPFYRCMILVNCYENIFGKTSAQQTISNQYVAESVEEALTIMEETIDAETCTYTKNIIYNK